MRSPTQPALCALLFFLLFFDGRFAPGQGLRITIPKRSDSTPAQNLNRQGVKEIQRHNLRKAEKILYKAYLIDPDDPFTLNNLGYISELEGKIDRARRYYDLAARENNSETEIAVSSTPAMEGRKLSEVTSSYGNLELRVNRGNILAMTLLEQGRSAEAEDILRETLKLDPRNPFTLNNLGFAMENQGELQRALGYYNQASMTHSTEPIVVALDPRWRGRAISDVAFSNEQAVRQRIRTQGSNQDRAALLEIQGVSALNHNDSDRAYDDFRAAYRLDPASAFSLNDMGYVSQAFGDEETAKEFFSAARRGQNAGAAVHLASHHEMVGAPVGDVADANSQTSDANLEALARAKRSRNAPIVLRRRNSAPVTPPPVQHPKSEVPRPPLDNAPVENTVPRPH